MSGHSKWANIKRQKEVNDKQKGVAFSKLSRLITLAVIESGGITDPENNIKLRLATDKAKQYNMPKDNIQKAINNGIGPDKAQLKEIIYEGFGPGGVGLIIATTTDNPNRTLSEIRNIFDLNGGKLANQGSVSYQFKKCGLAIVNKSVINEDKALSIADKLNAFDVDQDENNFYIYFPFENIGKIRKIDFNIVFESIETDYKPNTLLSVDLPTKNKIISLIGALEHQDDVHNVYSNYE